VSSCSVGCWENVVNGMILHLFMKQKGNNLVVNMLGTNMVGTNLKKKNSYKFYGKRVPKSFYFIFSDNTECSVDFKNAFFIPKMLQTFLDMKVLQLTRRH
jgi:hypothetical protein